MDDWNESRTRAAYDEVAATYANHFTSTEAELPLELAMIDHFIDLLAEPKRVLDAGCGAGRMMPHLAHRGCQVEGIDLSPEMVRRAHEDHPTFDVRVGSLTELSYADADFDGVFSWYSTIHSPDTDLPRMLEEARRVLKPGGHLLLAFQTGEGARDIADAFIPAGHHITLFRYHRSIAAMTAAASWVGFTPVASMERSAASHERDGQAVLILRLG